MATLVSVNVGLPRDVPWNGRVVHTGAWKSPADGARMVRRLNVDGDGQGDLGGHGGENRAVLVYQLDSYRHWAAELSRDDLAPGHFGENFTVDGLADDEVCIGDRYRIGDAVFEVTQPRVTCYRVGLRMGVPNMAALLVSHRRPGFYLRVLTEGEVTPGQEITKVASGPEAVTVAEIDALLYLPEPPRVALSRALRVPALSQGWKTWRGRRTACVFLGRRGRGSGRCASRRSTTRVRMSGRSLWPIPTATAFRIGFLASRLRCGSGPSPQGTRSSATTRYRTRRARAATGSVSSGNRPDAAADIFTPGSRWVICSTPQLRVALSSSHQL
jgi:MOSC domain-containing protein YiiM